MPMQAIADDSGCKGQGPVIVIAGLIGRSEWWANLSDQWAACLCAAPSIDYFKMHEAAQYKGQFAGFTGTARNDKVAALTRIMNAQPFVALHVTVDLASHQAVFGPAPKKTPSKKHHSKRFRRAEAVSFNPYFYAYNSFISSACFHLWDMGERERFDFIVDKHPSLGPATKSWYPAVRTVMMEPMRSIMP
jgi:hypothetical protein